MGPEAGLLSLNLPTAVLGHTPTVTTHVFNHNLRSK